MERNMYASSSVHTKNTGRLNTILACLQHPIKTSNCNSWSLTKIYVGQLCLWSLYCIYTKTYQWTLKQNGEMIRENHWRHNTSPMPKPLSFLPCTVNSMAAPWHFPKGHAEHTDKVQQEIKKKIFKRIGYGPVTVLVLIVSPTLLPSAFYRECQSHKIPPDTLCNGPYCTAVCSTCQIIEYFHMEDGCWPNSPRE